MVELFTDLGRDAGSNDKRIDTDSQNRFAAHELRLRPLTRLCPKPRVPPRSVVLDRLTVQGETGDAGFLSAASNAQRFPRLPIMGFSLWSL